MDTSVYSEAKGEYTKQLSQFIVPAFHRFFMETLVFAQQEEANPKRQLWKFQELLSQIPEWNIDKVQRETGKLMHEIQCDYLEELLTAVFIAHTKVLTAIRIGNKNKRVQITVPKLDHFLHRSLTESSRLLWASVYLFHNELSPIDKQKNHRQIEQLLYEGVSQAIRGLLPVKNILKDYLAEPEHDADTDIDDEDDDDKEDKENVKHVKPAEEETKSIEETKNVDTTIEKLPESELEHAPESLSSLDIQETNTIVSETSIHSSDAVTELPEISKIDIASSINETNVSIPDHQSVKDTIFTESVATLPESAIPVQTTEESPIYKTLSNTLSNITNVFSPKESDYTTASTTASTTPTPTTPTLIVATDNSVQFTNFDQVIQQRGNTTHIDYVEKERIHAEDDEYIQFMGDDTEPLSDFEELMEQAPETLNTDDFESLS